MGNAFYSPHSISDEAMDDYLQLTYLTQNEIFRIYKRLAELQNGVIHQNITHRFAWSDVVTVFPELRVNPFEDRLSTVFSSELDGRMSFEDMLDLCSALSPECSAQCKAQWALKLFDFNGSNSLEVEDISRIIDRLTSGVTKDPSKCLNTDEKEKIAKIILHEIDLDHTGSIVSLEFVHAVSKIPDFCSSFTLRL